MRTLNDPRARGKKCMSWKTSPSGGAGRGRTGKKRLRKRAEKTPTFGEKTRQGATENLGEMIPITRRDSTYANGHSRGKGELRGGKANNTLGKAWGLDTFYGKIQLRRDRDPKNALKGRSAPLNAIERKSPLRGA